MLCLRKDREEEGGRTFRLLLSFELLELKYYIFQGGRRLVEYLEIMEKSGFFLLWNIREKSVKNYSNSLFRLCFSLKMQTKKK